MPLSQPPPVPRSPPSSRGDPAFPTSSQDGAQQSRGRSREPQGATEEAVGSWPPARRCGLQGEGVDKGHHSAATVTFSYADLQREHKPLATLTFLNCMLSQLSATLRRHVHRVRTQVWPVPLRHRRATWSPLPLNRKAARQ